MASEIVCHATTVGLGPFKPAIRYNGIVYVNEKEYASEDEAVKVSQGTITKLHNTIYSRLKLAYHRGGE